MRQFMTTIDRRFAGPQSSIGNALGWLAVALLIAGVPQVAADCSPQEAAKLTASDGAAGDWFGCSVAASGDTAVIGAHPDNTFTGSAYVFVRSGGVWTQQAKLTASDGAEQDYFGKSVAFSGDTAVIGAYHAHHAGESDAGVAYVFVRTGGVWSEQAKLVASDAAADDGFGASVAISGDTVVIGPAYKDAAYVFVRAGGVWTEQAKLIGSDVAPGDEFGSSVAVSGDTAVVGASSGNSVYVFVRAGGVWTEQAKLTGSSATPGSDFGSSVAVSGDTAAIGAPADGTAGTDSGAAYVFARSGGTWTQQSKVLASDPIMQACFGYSVAIGDDTVVIGAHLDHHATVVDAGSAYVFVRSGGTWTEKAKLTASDDAAEDFFGCSVALTGDTAIIGAYSDDHAAGADAGSAYAFTLNCESACCAADSSCRMKTEADCTADGGVYQGEGVACEAGMCPCEYVLTLEVRGDGTAAAVPALDTYDCEAAVELTATPTCGSFVGWEGDLSGTSNQASITMNGNKTITAVFTIEQPVLEVLVEGRGSVALDPAGGTYDCGTSVRMTATPASGWYFACWSGDATGNYAAVLSIPMDGDRHVRAIFQKDAAPGGGMCLGTSGALIGLTLVGLVHGRRMARGRTG